MTLVVSKSLLDDYKNRALVCGSRGWHDYETFKVVMNNFIRKNQLEKEDTIFISGAALTGADALIIRFSEEFEWDYIKFPAEWNRDAKGNYDRGAGFKRNIEMINHSTHIIAFWDAISPGTRHSLSESMKRKIPTEVFFTFVKL